MKLSRMSEENEERGLLRKQGRFSNIEEEFQEVHMRCLRVWRMTIVGILEIKRDRCDIKGKMENNLGK